MSEAVPEFTKVRDRPEKEAQKGESGANPAGAGITRISNRRKKVLEEKHLNGILKRIISLIFAVTMLMVFGMTSFAASDVKKTQSDGTQEVVITAERY